MLLAGTDEIGYVLGTRTRSRPGRPRNPPRVDTRLGTAAGLTRPSREPGVGPSHSGARNGTQLRDRGVERNRGRCRGCHESNVAREWPDGQVERPCDTRSGVTRPECRQGRKSRSCRERPDWETRRLTAVAGTRRHAAPSAGHDRPSDPRPPSRRWRSSPSPSLVAGCAARPARRPRRRRRRPPPAPAPPSPAPTPVPGATAGGPGRRAGAPGSDGPVSGGGSDPNPGRAPAATRASSIPASRSPRSSRRAPGLAGVHPGRGRQARHGGQRPRPRGPGRVVERRRAVQRARGRRRRPGRQRRSRSPSARAAPPRRTPRASRSRSTRRRSSTSASSSRAPTRSRRSATRRRSR